MTLFRNILYITDEARQDSNLSRAVSLAENNQAQLTVAAPAAPPAAGAALPPGAPEWTELQQHFESDRLGALEALIAPYRKRLDIRTTLFSGSLFLDAIRAVLRDKHDLVIKRAEDPAWIDRLFGSDDMHLLRKCPCPVWLMKPEEKADYRCILAAVDFDPGAPGQDDQNTLNHRILDLAGSLSLSDFTELHVVHAWDTPAETLLRTWAENPDEACAGYIDGEHRRHQNGLDRLQAGMRERLDADTYRHIAPRFHLVRGPATTVIPEQAAQLNADLVVMGTVARTGVPGFIIGNTAEAILDQLRCSVLAVKPPGFTSPVRMEK